MATTTSDVVEARAKQREASKRATFAKLSKKPRAEREVPVTVGGEQLTVLFKAIGAREYDRLLGEHPPNAKQKMEGQTYNMDTFGPALVAAVCVDPDLSEDEAKAIWESEDWSRGEVMTLFMNAVELCNQGMDVPFTAGD